MDPCHSLGGDTCPFTWYPDFVYTKFQKAFLEGFCLRSKSFLDLYLRAQAFRRVGAWSLDLNYLMQFSPAKNKLDFQCRSTSTSWHSENSTRDSSPDLGSTDCLLDAVYSFPSSCLPCDQETSRSII